MNMSALADALQALQGVAVILLLIMAVGAWRQKTESTPATIAKDMLTCRATCDRRLNDCDKEIEKMRNRHHDIANWQEGLPTRLDRDYARKETFEAKLEAIDQRLGRIEALLTLEKR